MHDVVSLFYSTALQDSIGDEKMLTKDELLTIHGNWVNIEDDKEVVNVTIDEEIEAIKKEILENTYVDDDLEPEVDVIAATIDHNDKLTKALKKALKVRATVNTRKST